MLKAPERRSLRAVSARPARNPHRRRWWVIVLAVLLIGAGITTAGVITAPPAQAGFMGICDNDTSFPVPTKPGGGPLKGGTIVTVDGDHGAQFTVVELPDTAVTPMHQYRGGGLEWHTWGLSCMDGGPIAQTAVAQVAFELVAAWPARILGLILEVGYSTSVVDALLGVADDAVQALSSNVFLQWVPVMIMVTLIIAAFKVARGRARQGFGDVAWVIAVIVIVGGLLTSSGVSALRAVNDAVSRVAACVTFGVGGAGCEADADGRVDYPAGMVEVLAADTWGIGALGDMAMERPSDYTLAVERRTEMPRANDAFTVTVPVAAIPSDTPGRPTWGEIWRWTQTYTRSELHALQTTPALGCHARPEQSPPIHDVLNRSWDQYYDTGELCGLKWQVRAAVLHTVVRGDPDALDAIRGVGVTRLSAATASVGVLVLAIGIGVVGFLVLLYQLELVLLFLSAPVVGLFAIRRPHVGRRWAEMLLASFAKRIGAGLALGLILWGASVVSKLITRFGWVGIMLPLGRAVLTAAVMVAGLMLLRKLQGLLSAAVNLDDVGAGTAESAGMRVIQTGVAAAAGAVSAGTGLALSGAMRGAGRAALHDTKSVRGAWGAGLAGGTAARIANAMGNPRPRPTSAPPGPHPDPGPGPGPDGPPPPSDPPSDAPPVDPTPGPDGPPAGPDTPPVDPDAPPSPSPDPQEPGPQPHPRVQMEAAWGRVIAHPAIAPVVAGHAERAEARRSQAAHEAARLRQLLDHERERAEAIGEQAAAAAELAGQDPEQARRAALERAYDEQVGPVRAAVERAEQAVADAVASARAASQGAGALDEVQRRLLAGENPTAVAAELGGDDELAHALAAWVDAVRAAGYGVTEYED